MNIKIKSRNCVSFGIADDVGAIVSVADDLGEVLVKKGLAEKAVEKSEVRKSNKRKETR
jgi:hypothetical protein